MEMTDVNIENSAFPLALVGDTYYDNKDLFIFSATPIITYIVDDNYVL